MAEQGSDLASSKTPLGVARLAIGLFQGLALFGLHRAWDSKAWPATDPTQYWPMVLAAAFLPLVVLGGLGQLRRLTLVIWSLAGAALLVVFAVYDIWRQASGQGVPRLSTEVVIFTAAALFIAHHLIAGADQQRRWIAPYHAYFDTAWQAGVQLALSAAFTGVFWAVLGLGAGLFALIGIKAFGQTIAKDWFAFPATAVMAAAAVHLTDVRIGLTRGIRTVALTLLSWLMPLMAVIAAAFLTALPFTGLKLLWATRASSAVLLSASAVLIVLINAAYQDGDPERRPPTVLRWAGRLAAGVLTPLVAIAAYGLVLRVGQYGWTPERIIATACTLVAACYALGYLAAAIQPSPWMNRLEITNVAAAFVILAVIVALFTPIADPARLAVADQVGRLESGKVAPEKFDFAFLRFKAGRFGMAALTRLKARKSGRSAAVISLRAAEALNQTSPYSAVVATPAQRAANIAVYPKGRALPDAFLHQDWRHQSGDIGSCLPNGDHCEAYFADLDGDGAEEILLSGNLYDLTAFGVGPDGMWRPLGRLGPMDCKARAALRTGSVKIVQGKWKDLDIGGRRLRLQLRDPNAGLDFTCHD